MARSVNRLSMKAVEAAKAPGRLWDGGGLFQQVSRQAKRAKGDDRPPEPPAKWWAYRYRHPVSGKPVDFGLGSLAGISLARARELAAQCRALVAVGIDPGEARKKELAKRALPSFGECAVELHAAKAPGFRNAKHASQWMASLQQHAALLMTMPVD